MAIQEGILPLTRRPAAVQTTGIRYFLHRYARNRLALIGLWVVALVFLAAAFAPIVAPSDPTKPDFVRLLEAPSREHLLGTDDLGRDIASRVIFGARTSLLAGVISVGIALAVGLPLGLEQVCLDEGIDPPVQDRIHVPGLDPGAVILHQLVRSQDVGADLAPPGDLLLLPAEPIQLLFLLLPGPLVQAGPQHLHGHGPVLVLGALVLARDHDPGRQVGDADR